MAASQSSQWGLPPNWATSMGVRWTVEYADNDDAAGVT